MKNKLKLIKLLHKEELACGNKKIERTFSAILGFSCLVNNTRNYMETRSSSIRWKTWREKDRQKKQKRYKVQCGLCKKTFYNDYRPNHNKKYHSDYVKGKRPIPFHIPRAPLNPFTAVS